MNGQIVNRTLVVVVSAVACAVLTPIAAADAVFHTEHLPLTPVGAEPLRSGFVQDIKAEGPQIYAHELFVLNGARPGASYTVTRNFFVLDPECDGNLVFASRIGTPLEAGTISDMLPARTLGSRRPIRAQNVVGGEGLEPPTSSV